jgi:dTDP-4-dehydrorhamnose reductase
VKVMVTGAGGMLGRAVVPCLRERGHTVLPLDIGDADITDPAALRRHADAFRPGWLVHLAAWTNVDACEEDPARAMRVNGEGSRHAAAAAAAVGAAVLAISTDYVFDGGGTRPWREDDAPAPATAYGRSKLAGEEAVRGTTPEHAIVRTAWLFGAGGRNFVDTILEKARRGEALRVVDDQRGSPTLTRDLAAALAVLVESGARGTWHVTNSGEATWHDLAEAACAGAGVPASIGRLTTAQLARPARRPAYSVLDNGRYAALAGRALPDWRDALRRHLAGEGAAPAGGTA